MLVMSYKVIPRYQVSIQPATVLGVLYVYVLLCIQH